MPAVSYSKLKPSPICVMKARHLRVSRGPACVWTQLTHHRNIHCTQTATQRPGQHSCQRQSILYMLSTWLDLEDSLYEGARSSQTGLKERKRNLLHATLKSSQVYDRDWTKTDATSQKGVYGKPNPSEEAKYESDISTFQLLSVANTQPQQACGIS